MDMWVLPYYNPFNDPQEEFVPYCQKGFLSFGTISLDLPRLHMVGNI